MANPGLNLGLSSVDGRIEKISKLIRKDDDLNTKVLPGLAHLLDDYLDSKVCVTSEDFTRRLLVVFRESTDNTYQDLLKDYNDHEQAAIEAFVEGKPADQAGVHLRSSPSIAARQELGKLVPRWIRNLAHRDRATSDNEGTPEPHKDIEFCNWGRTVDNKPCYTYVPKTTRDVQHIVKVAKEKGLGVRCSGYRHSWSPVFARDGGILISTLDLNLATQIPNFTSLGICQEPPKELNSIAYLPEQPQDGKTKLVRVGCATTNEQLREWCLKDKLVTLPLNVIMVEITLGGSNAPICHGAGRRHQTLSDLVYCIEYVDANGEARMIDQSEKEFLTAASGCFGLIGVITHLTLKFEAMSYAIMKPRKVPVVQAIPPPPGYDVPAALQPNPRFTPAQMAEAQADFEKRASEDYYAEWFWFPYSDYAWVNTWETTSDPMGAEDYPSPTGKILQLAGTLTMQVLQTTAALTKTQQWFPLTRTTLISRAAMMNLPPYETPFGNIDETIKTWVPDALHFQRAIQNVRVRDVEVEMPLVPSKSDPTKPDWSYVQKAWWDAILHAYKNTDTCPQRMPLEMRIMGDSNVIMAPQRGNTLGTCSIEILTLQTEKDRWLPYAQGLLDTWMDYKDHDGKLLKTRPHWAKEWYPFTIHGIPWLDYLKQVSYKDEIEEFKNILAQIGKKHGWTLADLQARFSNDLFDKLYFADLVPISTATAENSILTEKLAPAVTALEAGSSDLVD